MNYEEAISWLKGERSLTNVVPDSPFETWQVRIAQADAAMTEQAYWIARAHKEGLIEPSNEVTNVVATVGTSTGAKSTALTPDG